MSFITYLFHQIKDEFGRACGMHERCEMHTKFWLENLKGRAHSEDLSIDGRTILEWNLGNRVGNCGLDVSGS